MSTIELTRRRETVEYETVGLEGEPQELLYELYQKIWCEAHYDCETPETQKFAKMLLPSIQRLNELWKFKK